MRLQSLCAIFRDSRGSVMIFTMFAIIFLLVIGGLAVDFAHQFTLRNEIQRSMDAAALAAAGKIYYVAGGTIPSAVRDYAVNFAAKNTARTGTITLARNDANDDTLFDSQAPPYGDILTGHWNNATRTFTKSLDATIVNAVMCRYKTTFPTSLFRLWGITEMSVQVASSIATSDPALAPPADGCTVPIGLSWCSFESNQIFTSNGCGTVVKFTTSNTQADSTNTAAWTSLDPAVGANANNIRDQVNAGACGGGVPVGTTLNSNNGMFGTAFDALETKFLANYNPAGNYTVLKADGTPAYTGAGWEVYVPIMGNSCPAGAITGDLPIKGWTRMVITQMWNPTGGNPSKNESWNTVNKSCLVNNPSDSQTWAYCTNPEPPSPLNQGSSRSVWGYYNCAAWIAPTVTVDAPLASMTDKLRLRR